MRGALTDATLPVVMRRTCVYPSRLLAAAVNCLVIVGFAVKVGGGRSLHRKCGKPSDRHELPDRDRRSVGPWAVGGN